MPHLIVECTENVGDSQSVLFRLLGHLHVTLHRAEIPGVTPDRIKSRLYISPFGISGQAESGKQVHITLRLISGRSPEAKRQVAVRLQRAAREMEGIDDDTSVTVEVVDMERATYIKNGPVPE